MISLRKANVAADIAIPQACQGVTTLSCKPLIRKGKAVVVSDIPFPLAVQGLARLLPKPLTSFMIQLSCKVTA